MFVANQEPQLSNYLDYDSKSYLFTEPRSFDYSSSKEMADGRTPLELKELQSQLRSLCPNHRVKQIEEIIFSESWNGKTYQQIAKQTSYNFSYIKDTGHRLWRKLSESLGEEVTKHNCRSIILIHSKQLSTTAVHLVPSAKSSPNIQDIDSIVHYSFGSSHQATGVPVLRGRSHELNMLVDWILLNKTELLGIFGAAGIGKTTLMAKCVEQINQHFDFVIWRSLRDTPDFEEFIKGILVDFEVELIPEDSEDVNRWVSCLLKQLMKHRVLLVLDDWSSLFQNGVLAGVYTHEAKYYGLLLRRLSESHHNSSVILTSREQPSGLIFSRKNIIDSSPIKTLHLRGLNSSQGLQALAEFGLSDSPMSFRENLLSHYSGNPFALQILANTICSIFDGNIERFLANDQFIYGEIKKILDSQFNRISSVEKNILLRMAEQPIPAMLEEMMNNGSKTDSISQQIEGIESLLNRKFLEQNEGLFQTPQILFHYLK